MSLRLFRAEYFRRHISCKYLCTEPPDNGKKHPSDKSHAKSKDADDTPVSSKNTRISSLLMSLKKSTITTQDSEQGDRVPHTNLSEVTKKHLQDASSGHAVKKGSSINLSEVTKNQLLHAAIVSSSEAKSTPATISDSTEAKLSPATTSDSTDIEDPSLVTADSTEEDKLPPKSSDKRDIGHISITADTIPFKFEKVAPRKMSAVTKKHLLQNAEVKNAVDEVAEHLGGNTEETIDALHTRFKMHSISKENMKDLLGGMAVDDTLKSPEMDRTSDSTFRSYRDEYLGTSRAKQGDLLGRMAVDETVQSPEMDPILASPFRSHRSEIPGPIREKQGGRNYLPTNYDLIEPLNWFPPKEEWKQDLAKSHLTFFDKCVERENLAVTISAPKNAFEEMIQWTDSGRMWTFPIDNEVGLEEEKKDTFADHIFLDRHLQPWCPKKGPIYNFMLMVCHGLSMNPYLTVKRKLAHIQWYQAYFSQKANKDILVKSGMDASQLVDDNVTPLNFVNIDDYACTPLPKKPDPPRSECPGRFRQYRESRYAPSNQRLARKRRKLSDPRKG